jgi:two-component system NtrC family sensor kinase
MTGLIEQAPFAIIQVDEDGRILEFNPAAEAMFGIGRVHALTQPFHAVLSPERLRFSHIKSLNRFVATLLRPGAARSIELNVLHADGHEFPVEVALARASAGEKVAYTAFLTDLSEKRRAEDDLARQRDSMRQAEKMTAMGSLLAGVAHELNNPLAILIGRATLMEDKISDPKFKADAGKIRDAAQRCARIVKMFLSMARQRPSERRSFQLNDVVRSALDLLGYNLRTSGIAIKTHLARDLPEIEADPDQIGQVVTNLIVNAQQATAHMTEDKRIVIGTTWNEVTHFVTMWVSDNGAGVPVELRERIFDPFFTTKVEGSGTGIGLSVSKSIIKNHQGQLQLEPTEVGATFSVSLPIVGATPVGAAAEIGAPRLLRSGRGPHILIVDDEMEVAEMMAETLVDAGYDPVIAYEGRGALVWLAEQEPDLILSDVRMPGLDGAGLLREIDRKYPAMRDRVIFVTGDTLSPGAAGFLKASKCASLEKPFTPAQLLEIVRQALPGKQAAAPSTVTH